MGRMTVREIWPEEFEKYIDDHSESEYVLVDVRQPEEYSDEHIPGAKLVPLGQIEARSDEIPSDRDVIFYCAAGSRSKIAALMISELSDRDSGLYSLKGGIKAWESRLLWDIPKVAHFEGLESYADYLLKAIDLEKGACLFYSSLAEKFTEHAFSGDLEPLAKAETAHARLIYGFMKKQNPHISDFDEIFSNARGDILEGGASFNDVMNKFGNLTKRDLCLHVMETALDIEYSAYDLYRVMSETVNEADAKDAFVSLAQAEKGHMKIITKALERCTSKADS